MFPITMIFVALLTSLAFIGIKETLLSVRTEQFTMRAKIIQSAADDGAEKLRTGLALQLANHVEVADVTVPIISESQIIVCGGDGPNCHATVSNLAVLANGETLDRPTPTDTPAPCDSAKPLNHDETNQCNLALGGALDEARRLFRLQTLLTSADGRVLGSVERQVRVRLFRLSPYAQISGIRDVSTVSSIVKAGDVSGFDSTGGVMQDTLLRSYAPCRNTPSGMPTPNSDHKYYWNEWTGHGIEPPPIESQCEKNSGDSSHFQNGANSEKPSTNSWGESN